MSKLSCYRPSIVVMLLNSNPITNFDRCNFSEESSPSITLLCLATVPELYVPEWNVLFDFSFLHFILISSYLVHTENVRVLTVQKLLEAILIKDSINPIDIPLPYWDFVIFKSTFCFWEGPILVKVFFWLLVSRCAAICFLRVWFWGDWFPCLFFLIFRCWCYDFLLEFFISEAIKMAFEVWVALIGYCRWLFLNLHTHLRWWFFLFFFRHDFKLIN